MTLVQALGKGDKIEQVLRAATALGVRAVHVAVEQVQHFLREIGCFLAFHDSTPSMRNKRFMFRHSRG